MTKRPFLTLDRRKQMWAYIFLLVPMLFYVVVRFAPTLYAMEVSLRSWNILSPEKPWVGLKNYQALFADPVFQKSLVNTIKYVVFSVPAELIIGLALALLLQAALRAQGFFRALYFIPYVTSTVAVSWVWRWMYQVNGGAINRLLGIAGIPPQNFLFSPQQALPSIAAVLVWQALGFFIIIYLAGLEGIPQEFYEAAQIDGAGGWSLFRHITLPLLNPTLVFLSVIGTINGIQVFTQVLNMSYQGTGGPLDATKSMVLFIYNQAFQSFKMGYASAGTVVLFAIILVITLIQLRVTSRTVEY